MIPLVKDTNEMHHGKCRLQRFRRLTMSQDISVSASLILTIPFKNLSLMSRLESPFNTNYQNVTCLHQ